MGVDSNLTGIPQYDQLEIVKTGTIAVNKPINTTAYEVDVPHGLGYIPIVFGYYTDSSDATYNPLPVSVIDLTGANSGKCSAHIVIAVDRTNVGVLIDAPDYGSFYAPTYSFFVRYFLMRNPAKKAS